MLPETTSKHLGTATELTCLVPIKSGFLNTLDTRTYATRLRAVFKVLQGLRASSREIRTRRPIVDIVEAARTVHAFSWSILGEQHLLLNVAFDRPWEPYIRVIWKDLGPLLDLFLCNCDGFVPSTGSFDKYAAFIRKNQVDTAFYYPASSLSVDDQRYLIGLEKAFRVTPAAFADAATALVIPGPKETACRDRYADPGEARVQYQLVLESMFGLRGFFPPEPDGDNKDSDDEILRRGTDALLRDSVPPDVAESAARGWLKGPAKLALPTGDSERPTVSDDELQGGIVSPYKRVSHGCMLLARVVNPAAARAFIGQLAAVVTRESASAAFAAWVQNGGDEPDTILRNVAFTFNGLKQLGLTDSMLAPLPKEFRDGMEARAGLLGDVRKNHPEHWQLPRWNVDITASGDVTFVEDLSPELASPRSRRPPVRMATVDIVFVLHARKSRDKDHKWDQAHPLFDEVTQLVRNAFANGVQVVSVQPLRRLSRTSVDNKELSTDHFQFTEGMSQPNARMVKGTRDHVPMGEMLVGFANQRKDKDFPLELRDSLIDKSSFLVVRKLRQHVAVFDAAVERAVQQTGVDREELLGKMMGRRRDGTPMMPKGKDLNDFDFAADESGTTCPFHAHIRRGNPRLPDDPEQSLVVPRIARRGLAYGPTVAEAPPEANRGIMFMAYNASIAEQFEIVQRWMAGGNTPSPTNGTTTYGLQPDPILGLPDVDGTRTYRFKDAHGQMQHVDLGPDPFVSLEWGVYLMTPSIAALEQIAATPARDLASAQQLLAEGERVIARLATVNDWAAALEDVSFQVSGRTAAVLARIRALGGVLRTPYGVIVASTQLGMHVLGNDQLFSVKEYQRRFKQTVGEGYLGVDKGAEYDALSAGPNAALQDITREEACVLSHAVTKQVLTQATQMSHEEAQRIRQTPPDPRIPAQQSVPLPLEPVVSAVLGFLAKKWFDIPDNVAIFVDTPQTRETKLTCPFSFLAASRYVFSSPHPRPKLEELATERGSALLDAVRAFVAAKRSDVSSLSRVPQRLFNSIDDDDRLARVLLGLVFGFVPTVHGSVLQVLAGWLADESFWRMQQVAASATGATATERAEALKVPIEVAMQMRPVPPLLHRTAVQPTTVGTVPVNVGDRVVVAISSMTQETLAGGGSKVMTIFGGDRTVAGHPTHSCPGSHIALGVIHGILLAILEHGPLTPTAGPLTVRVPIASIPPPTDTGPSQFS